jgi:hypothetical protein
MPDTEQGETAGSAMAAQAAPADDGDAVAKAVHVQKKKKGKTV